MTAESATVVGRDAELRAVAQFVDRVRGATGVLVLQGEAGIGKTTVWAAALDAARKQGFRVLVTRPVEAEAGLAFGCAINLTNVQRSGNRCGQQRSATAARYDAAFVV